MKFRGIKSLMGGNATAEIQQGLQDLFQGLSRLSLEDNFEAFEVRDVTIPNAGTVSFQNKLDFIPRRWFLTSNSTGQPIGDASFAGWDNNKVSLTNYGATSTVISAVFMR